MAGTHEGGKKAAAKIGSEELSRRGKEGGQKSGSQQASPASSTQQGKNVKNAPHEMGQKGGKASGSRKTEDK
ncbi:MAG: hypothetical protein K0S11_482 [Gammaproteobacteria bacterium]|jgi:general stress protein YciG|nr:hypothetical protein [Gammaproteobacteria bacterium]